MSDSARWAAFLLISALALSAIADPADVSMAAPASARARVEALHGHLLGVMKEATALGYAGREERLRRVIPGFFDVEFMAQKALGRPWKTADADTRARYLETFTRFMVANYAGRFDGFSGQSFVTLGEEPAPLDTMVVRTALRDPGGEDVELGYRMRGTGDAWKVIDVYLDGTVSELALRRSEFAAIVKREGLDALIAALDAKIEKLSSGKDA